MKIYTEKYKFNKMMNFLFGRKKAASPAPSETINKLRTTLESLEKRESFLGKQIGELRNQAVSYVHNKDKTRALFSLKKIKLLEKEAESISGQKFNLEIQISALTQAITNSETVNAMHLGRQTLVNMESKIDPDKVADIMDDLTENLAKVEDVTETVSRPIGMQVDEKELLDELNGLILEDSVLDVSNVKAPLVFPEPPKIVAKEEEEIRELNTILNA